MGIMLVFVACSSNDNEAMEEETMAPEEVIDPDLVGTWSGDVSGSFGEAVVTILLMADGTTDLSVEEGSADYCPIPNLEWFVQGNRFKMRGNDECDGTLVNFDAPYSQTMLIGTWNASSGNSGSFTLAKQ